MTCPTCGNAHSGECSVAALKARIDRVGKERDILASALAKEQDRRTHIARIVAWREATGDGLKEAKEACEAMRSESDAREPATLAAQIAWAEERCDAARKLATAKAADVDRLTALLAAETERALKMEKESDLRMRGIESLRGTLEHNLKRADAIEQERDTLRAQLAALHAKADPRIADLAAKVRAGNGTAVDLAVLCDAAGRAALLEALAAGKDEALAEADATITRLNRGAH